MNLPNKLSILRICFIPFVMFFYLQQFWTWGKIVAVVLFVIAVLTDTLDGYIARKYNLVTDLGKLLDTNADKILVLYHGELVGYDSHENLMKNCQIYQEIYASQHSGDGDLHG